MRNYILRRILLAIPTLIAISIISFIIIQLPKGDYLDQKIAQLEQQYGDASSVARADALAASLRAGSARHRSVILSGLADL